MKLKFTFQKGQRGKKSIITNKKSINYFHMLLVLVVRIISSYHSMSKRNEMNRIN